LPLEVWEHQPSRISALLPVARRNFETNSNPGTFALVDPRSHAQPRRVGHPATIRRGAVIAPVEDAGRGELEVIAWLDGLKRK